MYPRVEVTELFREGVSDWGVIYTAFYNYKLCGILPNEFGRDGYIHPLPMHHIQFTVDPTITARWANISDPFYRTVRRGVEADRDHWLVYAFDEPGCRYLLVDIYGPDAHRRPERDPYLRDLKVKIVDPWLKGILTCYEPPEDD